MKKIAVITPVYNNPIGLRLLMDSLVSQSFPKELYEIIIVDNGSNDDMSFDTALRYQREYPDMVKVLTENTLQGSYAARNKGIKATDSELIAMVDADCIPMQNWLESGVLAFDLLGADLVGGRVKFYFSDRPSAAGMYDSMTHMQVKHAIEKQGTSPTANLFVRREVFDAIGLFDENLRSGGDMIWTRRATVAGFKMKYSQNTIVLHPARNFIELIKKRFRTAGGNFFVWHSNGLHVFRMIQEISRYVFPPRPKHIQQLIDNRGEPYMEQHFWSIWVVAWACRYATNLGRFLSLIKVTASKVGLSWASNK